MENGYHIYKLENNMRINKKRRKEDYMKECI